MTLKKCKWNVIRRINGKLINAINWLSVHLVAGR